MSKQPARPVRPALHLLFSHSGDCLECCRQALRMGDSLVLLNTSVLHLLDSHWMPKRADDDPGAIRIYVPEADLDAHGLAGLELDEGITRIDDAAWAGLVMTHAHCVSWK